MSSPFQKAPSNEYVLNVAFTTFVAFCAIQAVFAIMANSQSMLADSEAMSVDAFTYLFNLLAERYKKKLATNSSDAESIELQRLYLELIPPLISVGALLAITFMTLKESIYTLGLFDFESTSSNDSTTKEGDATNDDGDDVSVKIMLIFSGGNMLLDIVNVTCFARADAAFGLNVIHNSHPVPEYNNNSTIDTTTADPTETTSLLDIESNNNNSINNNKQGSMVNLNMCSAWSHVCADTMRSLAVLIAAGTASIFKINGGLADAVAAMAVSIIILVSLLPLLRGLGITAARIHELRR